MAAAAAVGAASAVTQARIPTLLHSSTCSTSKIKRGGEEKRRSSWWGKRKKVELPVASRLGKVIGDFFWLRNLEVENQKEMVKAEWPTPSYPGLSGMDLMMADFEALKLYAGYFVQLSKVWSMPLPETYDAQKVAVYFNSRPHILVARILEVLSAFVLATLKMQASKRIKFARYGKGEILTDNSKYYLGHILKEAMLSLGPTFTKVGQSLSTRPDIIGSEISKALSELHDNVPPFPRSEAIEIIEKELGSPVEDHFTYISEETIAAASFGQVYKGCTVDGWTVAIKVQRPNLLHVVVRDIYILRLGLGLLRKIAKRRSDIGLYADELGKGFVGELDYILEALNATEFLEAHAKYTFISVPRVLKHLSGKKVLTMEWLSGESPNELFLRSNGSDHAQFSKQQTDARKCLLDLVDKGVNASLIQLLDTGLLHADPHPGNLCYTHEGKLGFLDFGLLCRMEKKHQLAMLASIIHIVIGDWSALVEDLCQMDVVPPGLNIRRVTRDLEQALDEAVSVDGVPDIKFSKVLGKIWSVAIRYHFRMPPYYTLVLRSLASLEGLAVAADPDFKTFQAACPYVAQKLIYDNSSATRKILESVVFNKRKEFQWQRLSLFLRIGFPRKHVHDLVNSDPNLAGRSISASPEAAYLILGLLSSNDGIVVRRLLMNANSSSLVRAMISNEALPYRQNLTRHVSDVIYQFIIEKLEDFNNRVQHGKFHVREQKKDIKQSVTRPSTAALPNILRDRRLKVIFYKILRSIRNDRILFFRFSWACFTVFVSATALALHHLAISISERYISPSLSFAKRRYAVSM